MRSARKYLNISGGHSCKNKRREERKIQEKSDLYL